MPRLFPFLLLLCLGLLACEPDPPPSPPVQTGSGSVFILNEGNFQTGNASLDLYDPLSQSLQSGVFARVNGRALGDVLQSLTFFNGRAYLVVNNSGKVEVIEPDSLRALETISGLVSPRYFLGLPGGKAYVSDLYADAISVIDLAQGQKTGEIALPGWTEQLLLAQGRVYVSNLRRSFLYLIDPQTDALVDSLPVGPGGGQLLEDGAGLLWLACGGNLQDSVPGRLYRIDPVARQVVDSLRFPAGESPSRLALNPAGDTLYYLNQGVFAMSVEADALPATPLIAEDGGLFYGLGVDPANGDLYLADAVDYVQRGLVLRYRPSGEKREEFRVGIIPNGFAFR